MPKARFFLNCAPPPHQTTKPSRGWLRVAVRELRLVLVEIAAARNKVTALRRNQGIKVLLPGGVAARCGNNNKKRASCLTQIKGPDLGHT